jgi:mRNA-degrading endonuclease RelE of RelBE toxin-antitoxin system
MKSVTTERFRKAMSKLPEDVQQRARQTYKLWKENNLHPGLHFKQIHSKEPVYSVRIGLSYRAVGAIQNNVMIWFWIGSHEEYNNLISNL